MKAKILLLAVVVLFAGCTSRPSGGYRPTSDEKEFVLQHLLIEAPYFDAQAIRNKHKDEIEKTLMINETIKIGPLRAIFYSYSIGSDILRTVQWASVVDGNLYTAYLNSYNTDEEALKYHVDERELSDIMEKADDWETKPLTVWASL